MKYLKSYNESTTESNKVSRLFKQYKFTFKPYEDEVVSHVDVVKDILVELTDENWDNPDDRFKIHVKPVGPLKDKEDKLKISINIFRESGFIRKDVYPILDRVDEYLVSEGYSKWGTDVFDGYSCNILYRWNPKSKN